MNKEMDAFFAENTEKLEELLEDFQEYKNKKNQIVFNKINDLCFKINELCTDIKWGVWRNYDLRMYKNKYDIGIETGFIGNGNDPIANFKIEFTSWSNKYWIQYGEQIKKSYPNGLLRINENRTYLKVYEIDGHNEDEIISKLKECYDCIINLS